MNVVDSSGWLEYFSGEGNADFFAPAIEDTEHRQGEGLFQSLLALSFVEGLSENFRR